MKNSSIFELECDTAKGLKPRKFLFILFLRLTGSFFFLLFSVQFLNYTKPMPGCLRGYVIRYPNELVHRLRGLESM